MKLRILTTLGAILLCVTLRAQSEAGIRFEKGTWAEVLAKAKAENKYVFLDAYAVWCGPCKWMDKTVFPTEQAGTFFNNNFINMKMDMQKGEGVDLASKYKVSAFPTYLFVDGNGELVHRFVGSRPVEDFISESKKALNPETQYGTVVKKFQAGEKDPEKLYAMAYTFQDASDAVLAQAAAKAYLETQDNWLTEKNARFMAEFTTSTESPGFKYMREHPDALKKLLGEEAYSKKLFDLAFRDGYYKSGISNQVTKEQYAGLMATAEKRYKEVLPEQAAELTSLFAVNMYSTARDMQNFAGQAVEHYTKYPIKEDWSKLNSLAWTFYQQIDNPQYLKTAVGWALESVRLNSIYANNDTVAALYYKLGDKINARKYAEEAVALGKAGGEDVSSTEELLSKISQMN